MTIQTETKHRHSWYGEMRSCGKAHRADGVDQIKWTCEHWICSDCDMLNTRNFNVRKVVAK